jgi:hypothetical protein
VVVDKADNGGSDREDSEGGERACVEKCGMVVNAEKATKGGCIELLVSYVTVTDGACRSIVDVFQSIRKSINNIGVARPTNAAL